MDALLTAGRLTHPRAHARALGNHAMTQPKAITIAQALAITTLRGLYVRYASALGATGNDPASMLSAVLDKVSPEDWRTAAGAIADLLGRDCREVLAMPVHDLVAHIGAFIESSPLTAWADYITSSVVPALEAVTAKATAMSAAATPLDAAG